jgi:hypothetical protein
LYPFIVRPRLEGDILGFAKRIVQHFGLVPTAL